VKIRAGEVTLFVDVGGGLVGMHCAARHPGLVAGVRVAAAVALALVRAWLR
jgi:pimeloyl-ACP methyl ester carboxylesterase